jgi:formylglycine-generating enzyme required for sulfatase activity
VGLDAKGLPDIDWVKIPAGEFIYQDGQRLRLGDYQMSRYPVTNQQFQVFEQSGGYNTDEWWQGLKKPDSKPEHWKTEGNRPVERVNWYEVMAFCRWLSAKTSREIRLPTEQEWEKAARGMDGREYPWGNEFESERCNAENKLGETSAVGIYPQGQSPYGLMDISGNVWEWCLNKYAEPQMVTADLSGAHRVLRGGSWSSDAQFVRSAYRNRRTPVNRNNHIGFRLVLP